MRSKSQLTTVQNPNQEQKGGLIMSDTKRSQKRAKQRNHKNKKRDHEKEAAIKKK
jgi:hypothetical protein